MSRRPNAAADKAAANQTTIKALLKLPANRLCSDCKRNKLPRWASWNLGVFICIRCSGIHRGMGTHISRVKSVDLDSWTDEQLQSMIKWGNARANKYWEANLAPGHVPSEAKIENFIRTKYESKRWVMEGGIPDPSTLDDSDEENVPLKVVQQKLESRQTSAPPPPKPQPKEVNLFDDNDDPLNISSNKSTPAPAKTDPRTASGQQTKPADSLLGLDFFGPAVSPAPRPASVGSNPSSNAASRPDLNRSILSLYAAAPRPQSKPHSPTSSFSAPFQPVAPQQSGLGGLNDAFEGLNFSTQPTPTSPVQAQKPNAFANLTAGMKKTAASPQMTAPSPGGFFSSTPAVPKPALAPAATSSGLGDLFDLGTPAPPQPTSTYSQPASSAFNLDNAWATPSTAASTVPAAVSSNDIWGSSSANAWGSPAVPASAPAPTQKAVTQIKDDDDWGSFSSGAPAKASPNKFGGGDDDLFRNVWS